MKQKLANYFKLGILFIGLSLVLQSCQDDEQIVVQNEHSHLQKGRIENYSKLNSFVEKIKKKSDTITDGKTTSLEQINGFDILYNQDMFIQDENGLTTFSIPIYKHNQEGKTFSNLIVKFSDTAPTEAFILNYYPTDAYMDAVAVDEQTPFAGKINSEPVSYDGSLDHIKSLGEDCTTIIVKYCNFGEEDGGVHLGGQNCTVGYYWFETYTLCPDDEPSLVDTPSSPGGSGAESTTNPIDYSNAGTSSNGNTVTQNPVVVPNAPNIYNRLPIDGLSSEIIEWLNNNPTVEEELLEFLEENNWSDGAKEEVRLTLLSESISDNDWDYSRTGMLNGHEALEYIAAYDGFDSGAYTMYKLASGHVVCESTIRRNINPEDANTIGSQDNALQNYFYVKIKDFPNATEEQSEISGRWYHYKLPAEVTNIGCFSCDMNYLISSLLEDSLVFFGRYVVPLEDVLIVVT
ncbi:hypothetical protein [uncultured Kordia sp.]|uniref:hypothetical protein n=1 Tax=uncultured Kordia sp. TaxID=507699 RepID=UPI0026279CFF|nr:hypothetical protein [uncultured Kordia sp.]